MAHGIGAVVPVVEPLLDRAHSVTRLPDRTGLHHVFALSPGVFSGSTPEGDAAFATLAQWGIKTLISVDGAQPDAAGAAAHGLRYVHLPHGYDGIAPALQLRLVQAARTLPGPVYVHCHHGQHRGPVAAAVICLANADWTKAKASAWLTMAGTAIDYTGLHAVVTHFRRPTEAALNSVPPDFPASAPVSGLIETMVSLDDRWDHLQAARTAGYRAPPNHPDLEPVNELVMVWEHYREAQRLLESVQRGEAFLARLKEAEAEARTAEGLLRAFARDPSRTTRDPLDQAFEVMAQSCVRCHHTFRDRAAGEGTK